MKHLFRRIRIAIISHREGFKPIYCPGCGNPIGVTKPEMMMGTFICGMCHTRWKSEIIQEGDPELLQMWDEYGMK